MFSGLHYIHAAEKAEQQRVSPNASSSRHWKPDEVVSTKRRKLIAGLGGLALRTKPQAFTVGLLECFCPSMGLSIY